MDILESKNLVSINGGALSTVLKIGLFGISAAGVFIASVIYGYIHPNKCN